MNKIFLLHFLLLYSIIGYSQNFKTGTFKAYEVQQYNLNDEKDRTEWLKFDRIFIITQNKIIFYYGTTDELNLPFEYVKTFNEDKYFNYQLRGHTSTGEFISMLYSCPKNESADSFYLINLVTEGKSSGTALRFKMRPIN